MKRIITSMALVVALSLGTVGSASAHLITIDPSANGHGRGDSKTVVAGGGPAHCRAAAPAAEESPVVSFTPPAPICD